MTEPTRPTIAVVVVEHGRLLLVGRRVKEGALSLPSDIAPRSPKSRLKAAGLAMAFKLIEAAQAPLRSVNAPPRRRRP